MQEDESMMIIPDKIYRFMLGAAYTLGVLLLCLILMASGSMFTLLAILIPPVLLFLFLKPDKAFLAALALHASYAILPGLPESLNLSRLCIMTFLIGIVASRVISRSNPGGVRPSLPLAPAAYGLVILVVLFAHGFGLRSLGSQMIGGGSAIAQMLLISLFILRKQIHLTRKQLAAGIIMMLIGSSLPMLADLLFVASKGAVSFQFNFIQPLVNALSMAMDTTRGSSVWRFQRAAFFAPSLISLAFVLKYSGKASRSVFAFLVACSIICIGASGHRIAVIECIVLSISVLVLWHRQNRTRLLMRMIAGLIASYAVVWALTPFLPQPFQRALSFIPGLPVSAIAESNASNTLTWRIDLWKHALQDWRTFFWTGKGFLHDPQLVESIKLKAILYKVYYGMSNVEYEYGVAVRDYHNGPIALFSDLGIFGLLIGSWLILNITAEQIRINRIFDWPDKTLRALHTLITADLITGTLIFFFVYGDLRSLLNFLFLGSVGAAILRCAEGQTNSPESVIPGEVPAIRSH